MHWKGGGGGVALAVREMYIPPPSRSPSLCPATVSLTASANVNGFVTDSHRHQQLWQHPPTAYLTASGAASKVPPRLMHPCRGGLSFCRKS